MAAVHILIFGEMAGFKMVQYLAMHMKKALKCVIKQSMQYEKKYFILSSVQIHGNNIKVYNNC